MSTYSGNLTAKFVVKFCEEGKSEDWLLENGRKVGGVLFFPHTKTTFSSDEAIMKKINWFVKEGWLVINKEKEKEVKPRKRGRPSKAELKARADEALQEKEAGEK